MHGTSNEQYLSGDMDTMSGSMVDDGRKNVIISTNSEGAKQIHIPSMNHGSMQMWFEATASSTILFKDWRTDEVWQMMLSCFFWFLVAFLYEVLKAVRQEIIIRDVTSRKCTMPVSSFPPPLEDGHCTEHPNNGVVASDRAGATNPEVPEQCHCVIEASRSRMSPPQELVEIQMIPPHGFMATSWRYQMFSKCHLIQTALHILQMAISYILMLVVMTFNVWLFLAVILGFGAGYFVCGWWHCGPVVDPNEHCH